MANGKKRPSNKEGLGVFNWFNHYIHTQNNIYMVFGHA